MSLTMSHGKLVSLGNYRLSSKSLGKGTFAKVELATHTIFHTEVALKVIVKSEIKDPYMKIHLYREASILGRLRHPNIVELIEICKSADIYCLVLEYVPGGTLFDFVQARGTVPEFQCRIFCKQLISAIAYMHKMRILHRDLKLENILLDGQRLVLVDFGLSNTWYPGKQMNTHCGSAGTSVQALLGRNLVSFQFSPTEYASPELFRKDITYGAGVDVWSFGVILFTMLIGHLPFQNESDKFGGRDTITALIQKITKGLVSSHYKELDRVSLDCRSMVISCLDVNLATRIKVKDIVSSPWIHHAPKIEQLSESVSINDISLASTLKERLNLKVDPEKILDHISKRKYNTTAGCFNVLKVSALRKKRGVEENKGFENVTKSSEYTAPNRDSGVQDILKEVEHVHTHQKCESVSDSQKEKVDERRSRSQDTRSSSWKRSFLNLSQSGKRSFSRLRRVDHQEKEDGCCSENGSGTLRIFGQKALEDITNSVRPLLKKSSSKGLKTKTTSRGEVRVVDFSKAPPHIPDTLMSYDARMKLRVNIAEREFSVRPRKPIR